MSTEMITNALQITAVAAFWIFTTLVVLVWRPAVAPKTLFGCVWKTCVAVIGVFIGALLGGYFD